MIDLDTIFDQTFRARGQEHQRLCEILSTYPPEAVFKTAQRHFEKWGNEDRLSLAQACFPDYEPINYEI